MEQVNLIYNRQYQIVICKECGIAPTSEVHLILGHLERRHRCRRKDLQAVKQELEQLDLLPKDLISTPPRGGPQIPGLTLVKSGYACSHELCSSPPFYKQSKAVNHIIDCHSKNRNEARKMIRKVCMQTFWKHPYAKYFIVTETKEDEATTQSGRLQAEAVEEDIVDFDIQDLLQQYTACQDTHLKAFSTLPPASTEASTHPWIFHSGFQSHLGGLDTTRLVAMSGPGLPFQSLLEESTFKVLLAISNQTVPGSEHERMGRQCGQILASFQAEPSPKPFRRVQLDSTLRVYNKNWSRLLYFLLRLYVYPEFQDLKETWRYQITATTETMIRQLHNSLATHCMQEKELEHLQDTRPAQSEDESDDSNSEYTSSDRQPTFLEDLEDIQASIKQTIARIQMLVTQISVTLVRHDLNGSDFRSPIVGYVASRVLKQDGSWIPPQYCTSFLSAMIHCMQLWLLKWVDQTVNSERDNPQNILTYASVMQAEAPRFLYYYSSSPIASLNRIRLLAMNASKNYTPLAQTIVSKDRETVQHRDVVLDLKKWRLFLQDLISTASKQLDEELLFGLLPGKEFDTTKLVDNINESKPGFSFINVLQNQLLADHEILIKQVLANDKLYKQFFQTDSQESSSSRRCKTKIREYLSQEQYFLRLLVILVHTTSGLPARVPELLAAQYQNTEMLRTIFLFNGFLLFCSFRSQKNQWRVGVRPVVRCLPSSIASILVKYLVLVIPFTTFLRSRIQAPVPASARGCLWVDHDGQWSDAKVRHIFKSFTLERLGLDLGVAHWRHIAIALDRSYLRGAAIALYGINSDWSKEHNEDPADLEGEDEVEQGGTALDLAARLHAVQASHSISTHNTIYGNNRELPRGLNDVLFSQFIEISHSFQAIFDLGPMAASSRKRAASSEIPADVVLGRRPLVAGSNLIIRKELWNWNGLLGALRKLFGSDAQPKSQFQQNALRLVIACPAEALIILPTGGGKTLIFVLPTLLPGAAVTVVIVPLVALRQDLMRRCSEWKINFTAWNETLVLDKGGVVLFVSAEQAVSPQFIAYIQMLESKGRLDRIVLDEAHLVLTAASYREQLAELLTLRQVSTSFVCMTATLPPSAEFDLSQKLGFSVCQTVRGPSNRANLKYHVIRLQRSQGPKGMPLADKYILVTKTLLSNSEAECKPQDRIICYVQSKEQGAELAEQTGAFLYHSTMKNKAHALDQWLASSGSRIMVATAALSAGLDYPFIRFVFHMTAPESMVNYAQETGRAGRDGALATCQIIQIGDPPSRLRRAATASPLSVFAQTDFDTMALFLRNESCLRAQLTSYLDGGNGVYCMQGRSGFECGFCEAHSSSSPRTSVTSDVMFPTTTTATTVPYVCSPTSPTSACSVFSLSDVDVYSAVSPLQTPGPDLKNMLAAAYKSGFDAGRLIVPPQSGSAKTTPSSSRPISLPLAVPRVSTHDIRKSNIAAVDTPIQLQQRQVADIEATLNIDDFDTTHDFAPPTSATAATSATPSASLAVPSPSQAPDFSKFVKIEGGKQMQLYQRHMELWDTACIACSFLQKQYVIQESSHTSVCLLAKYDQEHSDALSSRIRRGSLQFESNSACFGCGHPIRCCGRATWKKDQKCKAPDVMWNVLKTAFLLDSSTACRDIIKINGGPEFKESLYPSGRPLGMAGWQVSRGWLGSFCRMFKGMNIAACKAALLTFYWIDHLEGVCVQAGNPPPLLPPHGPPNIYD